MTRKEDFFLDWMRDGMDKDEGLLKEQGLDWRKQEGKKGFGRVNIEYILIQK